MKPEYKILIIACVAIVLLYIIGSIVSRQISFNYALLVPISFFIYAAVGFFATKTKSLKTGILFSSLTGIFDATIGWKISMLLNANTGKVKNDPNLTQWIITIIIIAVLAGSAGLIGGGIFRLLKSKKVQSSN